MFCVRVNCQIQSQRIGQSPAFTMKSRDFYKVCRRKMSQNSLPFRFSRGLAFVLSILMLAIYCGFILLVAYAKPFLGSSITPGLSWGILLGALVIIVAWVLTFVYVLASNKPSSGK